ncbi:hypothetical protein AQ915_25870 [Burkholderia pseudomallei]|uniref:hypothetical protein n=1 Tax=Burkholderia pseudomallei TaxID=28450 RepID=UPI00050EABE0|nr:hypothetical protein [Burkholderia pseudomallei]KGC61347.1 hypothetical protein DP56_622 [Burkholderia pseudomallei]ONC42182.1 hypothetical protein AQ915_25870 [Burkholderia pseudomallei]
MSKEFVSPSIESFKKKVKLLRSLVGKELLPVHRAYELAARICGHQNWYVLSTRFKRAVPQPTIWDEDLDTLQLIRRREFQVSVLMEEARVTKSEAEHILDGVRISSRVWRKVTASDADAEVDDRVDALSGESIELKTQPAPSVTHRKRRTLVSAAGS